MDLDSHEIITDNAECTDKRCGYIDKTGQLIIPFIHAMPFIYKIPKILIIANHAKGKA